MGFPSGCTCPQQQDTLMMSHFNDVTGDDLWLATIPRLSGSVGGYIDSVGACRLCACRSSIDALLNLKAKFPETRLLSRWKKITLQRDLHSAVACWWHHANGATMDGLCLTDAVFVNGLLRSYNNQDLGCFSNGWNCKIAEHHFGRKNVNSILAVRQDPNVCFGIDFWSFTI